MTAELFGKVRKPGLIVELVVGEIAIPKAMASSLNGAVNGVPFCRKVGLRFYLSNHILPSWQLYR